MLSTSRTKKQNKRALLLKKSVMKKEFSRMAKAVSNQVLFCFLIRLVMLVMSLVRDIKEWLVNRKLKYSLRPRYICIMWIFFMQRFCSQNFPDIDIVIVFDFQAFCPHCKTPLMQVNDSYYRPYLKTAVLARLSAVHQSLKIANKQAGNQDCWQEMRISSSTTQLWFFLHSGWVAAVWNHDFVFCFNLCIFAYGFSRCLNLFFDGSRCLTLVQHFTTKP